MEEKLITAVDFDGTLVENKFPEIGIPKIDVIEKVRKRKKEGRYIILWTCRAGKELQAAIEFCESHDIPIDNVNKDAPWILDRFGEPDRLPYCKVFADEYIDDKGVNPDDWNL